MLRQDQAQEEGSERGEMNVNLPSNKLKERIDRWQSYAGDDPIGLSVQRDVPGGPTEDHVDVDATSLQGNQDDSRGSTTLLSPMEPRSPRLSEATGAIVAHYEEHIAQLQTELDQERQKVQRREPQSVHRTPDIVDNSSLYPLPIPLSLRERESHTESSRSYAPVLLVAGILFLCIVCIMLVISFFH